MARHIVRLKLALTRATLASVGIRGRVAFGVAYLFAVIVGLMGAGLFVALRIEPPTGVGQFEDIAMMLFGAVFLTWVFGPVLTIAAENTLEVDRLALFPLTRREMMTGLLLASMAGFGGLATAIALVGAVAGLAPSSLGAVLTVAGVLLLFAISVAASRLVSTALSAATMKRRWRDVALTIVPVLFFVMNMAFNGMQLGSGRAGSGGSGGSRVALQVLRVLPSAPAAWSILWANEGRWALSVAGLLLGGWVLVVLVWLWSMAVERVSTSATESGGSSAADKARAQGSLFPRLVSWLPRTRVGAVAAKELRLNWRDPRRRAGLLSAAVFAFVPLISLRSSGGVGRSVVLIAVFPAVMLGLNAINLYGFDGPAFWMHLAAGDDARADLLGKNLEQVLVVTPVVVVEAVLLAAVGGGWGLVVPTLVLAAMSLGVMLGLGNVTSVVLPMPMPDSKTNTWASNSGQGIQTLGPVLLALVAAAVVIVPCAVLTVVWRDEPVRLAALAVGEFAVGVLAWWAGLTIAVRRSAGAQAELLARLTRRPA